MITYKLYTDKGKRQNNEDSIGMIEKEGNFCFVVADGLGGHGKGEVASALVVNEILKKDKWMPQETMVEVFVESQNALMKSRQELHCTSGMMTTAVVLVVNQKEFSWGHVGDSRLYHFVNGKLKGRTMDHSVPQKLVLQGRIKESEIRNHPDRSRLLRAMGSEWNAPKCEVSKIYKRKWWRKEAFLLCSDGFWELIDESQMTALLKKSKSVEEWIESMVCVVKENGRECDMDNISVIGVFADGKKTN